jgi:hypothetical protein
MEEKTILRIIANEMSNADIMADYKTPLDYYLGNPNGKEIEGRSTVVSTDVADAVEWVLPQIMKSFTQNNEVVIFDPLGPEDELQSELESQYVYDVIMKENDGFIILHQFVKDALLQNNGIIKVYYENKTDYKIEAFSGLVEEQVVAVTQDPNIEVLEYTPIPDGTYAMKIRISMPHGRIVLESVPPEQFRVNGDHNSISLENARFTAHVVTKTVSDLIKVGFDPEILSEIGYTSHENPSDFRFQTQGENVMYDDASPDDPSQALIEISECYLQIDLNEDGVSEFVKITVAGTDSPTHVLSIEEMPYSPWVATTAILMSHKFRGLSIYDRLKQIQEQKTSLWRNMFDNIYLQNNQRNIVVEGQVNMDDVLVSRPGGIIRAKRLDAIMPLQTPQLGEDAYTMMQYLDSVRAGRVGVSPEGEATPQKIGARVGSEGVDRLLTAKEELVGLIVRVVAETGIKPLCVKVRDLCTRHVDAIQDFKFRGQWVKTNPAEWNARSRTTVRVGTGTGNHDRQVAVLERVLEIQSQLFQMGSTMITPQKVYAAIDDLAKFGELNGASKYFLDPASPEGQQAAEQKQQQQQQAEQEQKQQQIALLQAQLQTAEANLKIAQAQQDNVVLKAQVENLKAQLLDAKQQAEAAGKDADRTLKKYEIETKAAIELTRIEVDAQNQQEQNALSNRKSLEQVA